MAFLDLLFQNLFVSICWISWISTKIPLYIFVNNKIEPHLIGTLASKNTNSISFNTHMPIGNIEKAFIYKRYCKASL